jgi:putative ABC transport system substrate-binding protein
VIKRACLLLLGMFLVGQGFIGCTERDAYKVYVLQWGDAQVYYDAYKGLADGLMGKGYEEGKTIELTRVIAKDNYSRAVKTLKAWKRERPYLIVTLGTKATLAAKEVLNPGKNSIPLIFTACSFPYLTGIIDSYSPQEGITGIGTEIPIRERVSLLLEALPNTKRVGIPYFIVNPQASITCRNTKRLLEEKGISVATMAFSDEDLTENNGIDKIIPKIERLAEECDLIYIVTDPVFHIPCNFKKTVAVAMSKGKPVIGCTVNSAKEGALLAPYVDYYDAGVETATLVDLVLNGEPVSKIHPRCTRNRYLAVNIYSARKLGINLPRNILLRAKKIFTEFEEGKS